MIKHFSSAHEEKKSFKCKLSNVNFTLKKSLIDHNSSFHGGIKLFYENQGSIFTCKEFIKEKIDPNVTFVTLHRPGGGSENQGGQCIESSKSGGQYIV